MNERETSVKAKKLMYCYWHNEKIIYVLEFSDDWMMKVFFRNVMNIVDTLYNDDDDDGKKHEN